MYRGTLRFTIMAFLLILLTIAPVVGAFAQEDRFSDLRSLAMGSAGIALYDSDESFHKNPAALYRSADTRFIASLRYGETLDADDSPVPWIQRPVAGFSALISNPFVALTIGLANVLEDREASHQADQELFTAHNTSRFQLTASYGWRAISFGFHARGGSMTQRNVTISAERPLFDYISQTYLDRYDPVADGDQLFGSGLGIQLSYQWITIGLLTNSLFSIDEVNNQLMLDITEVFDGSALGLAVTTPKFNRNNELNRLVLIGAFDVVDIGNDLTRSVRMGLEGKVQFLSTFWVALRGGYREVRPAGQSLFTFAGNGEITAGLGMQFGNYLFDLVAIIPLSDQPVSMKTGVTWKL